MWHVANKGSLAKEKEEGGGKSRLVSLKMWHITNEDLLTGERKVRGATCCKWKSNQ
jgi:hypothetical protein